MIALSNLVPAQSVRSSVYALADMVAGSQDMLGPDETKELVTLGAFLWRKSQALGEDGLDLISQPPAEERHEKA